MRVIATVLVALSLVSGVAAAQVSATAWDARPFLAAEGLAPGDVQQALTLVTPPEARWMAGVDGELRASHFTLIPESGAGEERRTLVVTHLGLHAEPLRVSACVPGGACEDLALERRGSRHAFSTGEGRWTIKLHGNPCEGSLSCVTRVPSWALEKRRALGGGAMAPFPAVVTVVGHKKGLALVDAATGAVWGRLGGSMGRLRGARFLDADRLALDAAEGTLVLDFAKDEAVRFDADGIARADAGIGALDGAGWTRVATVPANGGAPLAVGKAVALWRKAHVAWPAGAVVRDNPVDLERAAPQGDDLVAYARPAEDLVEIWSFAAAGATSAGSVRVAPGTESTARLGLSGPRVFQYLDGGLVLLTAAAPRATSLSDRADALTLVASGHAVRRDESGGGCRYVHFRAHDDVPTSLKESGLAATCGLLDAAAVSGGRASLTSFDGSRFTAAWLAAP